MNMKDGIAKIIDLANDDYARFIPPVDYVSGKMYVDFVNGWDVLYGKKYIKIVTKGSVWGFIVNTDDDVKFKMGDILKPASYKAPARNFVCGNVLDGDFSGVRWATA